MAASHFKGHPQGDKPSATKETHPKHNWFAICCDVRLFFTKMLEHFAAAGGPKTINTEKLICCTKCCNFFAPAGVPKEKKK